jgi:diguanylate cyclase (GGDEF)-like protein
LDGFKNVNDTLGHNVGDRVLIKVGRDLASIVRPSDTVARLGGDEFAILMTDLERPEAAVDFAHRIVSVVRGVVDLEGNQFDLSISVGLAFGGPTKGVDQLISEADAAMYEAKARGKDCVEVFRSEMRYDMLERLDFTSRFHGALARSEFFLDYQPIFSLADQGLSMKRSSSA